MNACRMPKTGLAFALAAMLLAGCATVDRQPPAVEAPVSRDAQLEAAIEYLKKKIAEEPRAVPEPPPYPDKSFAGNAVEH